MKAGRGCPASLISDFLTSAFKVPVSLSATQRSIRDGLNCSSATGGGAASSSSFRSAPLQITAAPCRWARAAAAPPTPKSNQPGVIAVRIGRKWNDPRVAPLLMSSQSRLSYFPFVRLPLDSGCHFPAVCPIADGHQIDRKPKQIRKPGKPPSI